MRKSYIAFVFSLFVINASNGQIKRHKEKEAKSKKENRISVGEDKQTNKFTGTASYYADKFIGRKTANGQIYSHKKISAACNLLPLGTWIRVTNLKNMRSVIVKVTDHMHRNNKRLIDLSLAGAQVLGYIKNGLTHVRMEVLGESLALH